ncbi:MAG TPA: WD40 repeat domain-containing protein [Gemmataceae bacterium]|nr:WD40 repeat domain-containing protein [Gemmataceae bacterium]
MSQFRWTRWIVWTALACVLVVLGIGIYQAQQPQPRWQTAKRTLTSDEPVGSIREVRFSRDGTKVITFAVNLEIVPRAGTIGVWDRDTGHVTRYPGTGRFLATPVFSEDNRYCAGETTRHMGGTEWKYAITLVDLDEGRQLDFPLTNSADGGDLAFSPTGDILAHTPSDREGPKVLRIFESATGKLLDQRQSFGLFEPDTFSDDHLFHYVDAEYTIAERWSLATRKPADTFGKPGLMISGLSRDRHALILAKPAEEDKSPQAFARWDLASRELTISPAAKYDRNYTPSPDGKWVADWDLVPGRCHLIDVASGESKASVENVFGTHWTDFSPDSRFLAARYQTMLYALPGPPAPPPGAPDALKVYAIPSMNLLWKTRQDNCKSVAFSQDSGTIYASFESEHAIRLFETETGNPRGAIDMPCLGETSCRSTSDGRHLLIHRWDGGAGALGPRSLPERVVEWIASFVQPPDRTRDTIVVYDTVANRERFRLTGLHFDNAWLSDDGATLVTVQGDSTLQCWDVVPKPLHWAVGIPAGLGAALLALTAGYGRWRPRKHAIPDVKAECSGTA